MSNLISELNRAKYAGLDFDTHGDDLRSRLQVQFAADFNDFAISGQGIMLLDLVAYGLDALSFYLDRRVTEVYLATARTRKGVARIARQLGYPMGGAVSSSTELDVAVVNTQAFSIPIPQGFRFKGPNNLIFEAARTVTFPPSSTATLRVPVYEGETFSETFVSDGTANQVFELRRVPDDKSVVQGTVRVLVDGSAFSFVPLLEYGAVDQFEVGFNDEPATIRFGDGLAGNVPATGATIQVTYVTSRGRAGQCAKNTIKAVDSPLVVAFTTIQLSITNPIAAVGGDDLESLSSAKTFAPKVNKTRKVAVTGEDYTSLAGSFADPLFGRVAVAKAISARSADDDLELQNQLTNISDLIETVKPALDSATSTIVTELGTAAVKTAGINMTLGDVASAMGDIETAMTAIVTASRAIKNKAGEVGVDTIDIQTFVVSGKAAVDAITTSGASTLTTSDKNVIKGFFDLINTEAVAVGTAISGTVTPQADGIITQAQSAQTTVDGVGTDLVTTDTLLNELAVDVDFVESAMTTASAATAQISLVSTDDLETSMNSYAAAILDHVDKMLAADCRTNLVSVPILTRDAAGFYTAPSAGLVAALQIFLDARKEVTQTVSVTSGSAFLVPAVISARVGVRQGFSAAVIGTAVSTAIDGVLRNREFGDDLYESDLEAAVRGVAGVAFSNVSINGYSIGGSTYLDKLDASGNLVVEDREVITKGSVTVTTEAA